MSKPSSAIQLPIFSQIYISPRSKYTLRPILTTITGVYVGYVRDYLRCVDALGKCLCTPVFGLRLDQVKHQGYQFPFYQLSQITLKQLKLHNYVTNNDSDGARL